MHGELATVGLTVKVRLVGASFIMTDTTQSIAIGSLRGQRHTPAGYWLTGLCLLDRVGGPHRNLCFASLLIQRFLRRAGSLEFERSPAGPRP
jgi:hypothetical protein